MRYTIIMAVLAAALGAAGCERAIQREDAVETVAVQLENCIETRCVVVYQRADDNTAYWTDQYQRFCPSFDLFEAWGTEPEKAYHGTFSMGQFTATGLDGAFMKSLPAGLMNATLAELVYYGFTAGAGFEPAAMTAEGPVRIEGQRYEAITVDKEGTKCKVTLYRNADTGVIELARVTAGGGVDWLARSYNRRYHDRFERMIPRGIDVFDIQQGIAAKKLLIQFDYIDVK